MRAFLILCFTALLASCVEAQIPTNKCYIMTFKIIEESTTCGFDPKVPCRPPESQYESVPCGIAGRGETPHTLPFVTEVKPPTIKELAEMFDRAFETREHAVSTSSHAKNSFTKDGEVPPDATARHEQRVLEIDAEYKATLIALAKDTLKVLPASADPEWKKRFEKVAGGDITDFKPIQARIYLESLPEPVQAKKKSLRRKPKARVKP